MKKNGKVILGFATGLVILVALTAIAFSQKPSKDKPQKDTTTWSVQILPYESLSGMEGGDHIYTSEDPNVRITVYEATTGQTVDHTTIKLWIYENASNDDNGNPLETWVKFFASPYDLIVVPEEEGGPLGCCGFPRPDPCSLHNFLFDSNHPKEGYEHVMFSFVVCDDLEDETVFPINGNPIDKYSGDGAITIYIWNSFEPLTLEDPFPYHTVMLNLAHLCNTDPDNPDRGYHITRTDQDRWEFWLQDQILDVRQSYIWEEITGYQKNKRPIITTTSYVPQTGLVNLSYKIVLIKNTK